MGCADANKNDFSYCELSDGLDLLCRGISNRLEVEYNKDNPFTWGVVLPRAIENKAEERGYILISTSNHRQEKQFHFKNKAEGKVVIGPPSANHFKAFLKATVMLFTQENI